MARLSLLGLSSDYRTNRWKVWCDCGKETEPPTTMFSTQQVVCQKCRKQWICDYNAEPPSIVELK